MLPPELEEWLAVRRLRLVLLNSLNRFPGTGIDHLGDAGIRDPCLAVVILSSTTTVKDPG
jgi:hypothetical protein